MSALEEAQKQQVLLQAKKAQERMSVFGTPLPEPPPPEAGSETVPMLPAATGVLKGIMRTVADPFYPFQAIDDTIRSIASGVTANFADEAAAGASAALGQGTYEENVAAERARDVGIPEHTRILGGMGGGVATGTMAGKAGLSLLAGAKPTIASLAGRGAAEGAVYGAAYGAGSAEEGGRLGGAAKGGAIGAVTGGVTAPVVGALTRSQAPGVQTLKKQAQKAYKSAERAGVVVTQKSFKDVVDDIAVAAKKAGIDPTLHPKATAALKRLTDSLDDAQPFEQLDILRRVVKGASASIDADERRVASIMIDKLDDYMSNLTMMDVEAGNPKLASAALRQARDLWSKFRKGEMIETAITRAQTRAEQFSGSGMENALRTEFRQIAQNAKKMRLFTNAEQLAIRKVARGGPVVNALRMIGKFAVRGPISGAVTGGGGFAVGGPAGAAAAAGAGEIGRRGATALTKESARLALERVLTGRGPVTLTAEQAALLRTIIVGEQAGISSE